MRRSGKTTRTVNDAIEKLFTKGNIIVPSYNSLVREYDDFTRGRTKEFIDDLIIDPDYQCSPHVQRHLFKKIVDRLMSEHREQFKVNELNGQIILKNENRESRFDRRVL